MLRSNGIGENIQRRIGLCSPRVGELPIRRLIVFDKGCVAGCLGIRRPARKGNDTFGSGTGFLNFNNTEISGDKDNRL